jgi:hypothetical protein
MCLGPLASAVMKGRLISYCCEELSAIFAFSASSLMRCRASGCRRSPSRVPLEIVQNPVDQAVVPVVAPRWVSPLVAFTSNTPSPISSTEMSKVPPPRS